MSLSAPVTSPEDRQSGPWRKPEPDGPLTAGLYLVATPIGNLEDITLRALRILDQADVIACEDTRVSRTLLSAYGIRTPVVSYHDHNAAEMRPKLLAQLKAGQAVALISDAGTPLISDPGFKLARACIEEGIALTAVPGPSAVLAGLSISGLPAERFCFAGFLPPKHAARARELRELAAIPTTLVFYEAPSRVAAMLADAAAILGNRQAALTRELTKKFEEARRDSLAGLAAWYRDNEAPRGEVAIVIGPPQDEAGPDPDTLDRRLREALAAMSLKEAVAHVTAETARPRREVYARALAIAKEAPGDPAP